MSKEIRNVTEEYRIAENMSMTFDPGIQPDIASLMRKGYMHGYAHALIDNHDAMATVRDLIEVQLNEIMNNALELSKRIPRPVRYLGEDVEGLPAIKINTHLNEIRRLLATIK